MKKIFYLFLLTFGIFGCSPDFNRETKNDYNIVMIENCEYIEVDFATGLDVGYYSLTHKGNCKNKIHNK
jgi:hypothetical protein